MANKSIDNKLVKITEISRDTQLVHKTLGLGLVCNVSDLIFIIGNPDLLVVAKEKVTFQKGPFLVVAQELENY